MPVTKKSQRSGSRDAKSSRARGSSLAHPWWLDLSTNELLDVRVCDLGLQIPGSALEERVAQLHEELDRAGLRFKPHVWLSTDWMTPDGVPGFAVPFYLAHPRLMRLEHSKMLEVEGGTRPWCMKLLRHEAGHAVDNAFRLHWTRQWRETFGKFSIPYTSDYAPDPESRDFVHHLGFWYSQSHPAEDYAESFAEWLRPGRRWRTRYRGWPVLSKLEALDEMMQKIAGQKPKVTSRARPESMGTLRFTLRTYYEQKQRHYADAQPEVVDAHLFRLFARPEEVDRRQPSAARFLRKIQTELRNRVAHVTQQPKYLVDQALTVVIVRCRELDLRTPNSAADSKIDATVLLTMMTMRFVHAERVRYRR